MRRSPARAKIRAPLGSAALAVLLLSALPATAGDRVSALSGLWQGTIVYQPAELELEATLELGLDSRGRLVGTVDIPSQDIHFLPLSEVEVEDGRFRIVFRWPSERRGTDAPYVFVGEFPEGEEDLTGTFVEGDVRKPFRFQHLGPPGTPRPEVNAPPLHDLSTDLAELRRAFNEDEDRVRLVLLLSPT